jgi:hypothetical protein
MMVMIEGWWARGQEDQVLAVATGFFGQDGARLEAFGRFCVA